MTASNQPIPGNEHALERLRDVLDTEAAIAFVGAGASAGLYPLWGQLITTLIAEVSRRGLADDDTCQYWRGMAASRPQQVIRGIKQALVETTYGEVLRAIFRPKLGSDGNPFTPIHSALLRVPFRGYVTTNYDPGLLEARLTLRPDSRATGFATWKDVDAVHRWFTGDIFREEPCPILFAHGLYERSDTIVLGAGEYREAYELGTYRRLFDKLWGQEHLVFVGFGFSDPWFDFLADEVLTQTAARAAAEPRHIALLGLREDEAYTPEMRRMFQDQYGALIVFYRIGTSVGGEDHSALQHILDDLAAPRPAVSAPPASPPKPSPGRRPMPQCWTHETTEDARYVEPGHALARLDRWTDDPTVRMIAITGLGGQGKTALVGHWLKQRGGAERRPYRGLFYWSFYAERDVHALLQALIQFATQELTLSITQDDTPLVEMATEVLRQFPLLLVLDGLEVLQERPGTVAYGVLLEDDLRALLETAYRVRHDGLVLLTSRFPFADLMPYLGRGLQALELDQLTPVEGAALLERCEVGGTAAERGAVSQRLEGHALGLRVFAAALADGDPTRLVTQLFDEPGLRQDEPLERKLRHLLAFYEHHLTPVRTALLGLISLFRTPVDETTIHTLAHDLSAVQAILGELSAAELHRELQGLCHEHLLRPEHAAGTEAYTCHPILRDHFRHRLLAQNQAVAGAVADLIAEQPDAGRAESLRELEPVLAAIELLLDAGAFERADELYRQLPENRQIFKWLPAPHAGLQCALGFVADADRRRQCEAQLSAPRYAFYLNAVALNATQAGEFRFAMPFYDEAAAYCRRTEDKVNLSVLLLNYADLSTLLGQLTDAEAQVQEVLMLVKELEDEEHLEMGSTFALARKRNAEGLIRDSLSSLGASLTCQGRVADAMQAFEEANAIQQRVDRKGVELYSGRGIQWAELLLRLGQTERARALTEANLTICEQEQWYNDVASCHWLLGRADTAMGHLPQAAAHLAAAEAIMRRGHQLRDLPALLLAYADLERCHQVWEQALHHVEEALRLAAPRDMRLVHADALVLRGRILVEHARVEARGQPETMQTLMARAQDDAKAARALARQCGYAWAERDAVALLAETWQTLGDAEKAHSAEREREVLSQRLRSDEPA